jgi:hypothetical protein
MFRSGRELREGEKQRIGRAILDAPALTDAWRGGVTATALAVVSPLSTAHHPLLVRPAELLRRHHDATKGLAALDVRVRGDGLGELERPVDLDAQPAARDSLE